MTIVQGWLDGATLTRAWGWATAPIVVKLNSETIASLTPSVLRKDIEAPRRGFDVPLDPLKLSAGENELIISFAESGAPIGNGVKRLTLNGNPQFISGQSATNVARGLWMFENVRRHEDVLDLDGWHVSPPGGAGTVFSNGKAVAFTSAPSAQLQSRMWLPPEVTAHQFSAQFQFPNVAPLQVAFGVEGQPYNANHTFTVPKELSTQAKRENISRVSGGGDALKFDVFGLSVAEDLRRAFTQYGKIPLAGAAVLDWGIGAGRVARFLKPHTRDFYGVDIDAENLAWCNENLQPGKYLHIETAPPTPLPDRSFDFIYGVSVLTHLTQDYERLWLAELRRLVKDDGVVALTTLGPTALMVMGHSDQQSRLAADGFIDLGENRVLSGHVPDGYYRNVAHSFAYVHRVWGKLFTIEDVIPGAISNLQDLVILRPR